MAKQRHEHENGLDNNFQLEEGAWGKVDSHVGTLNIVDSNGSKHEFGKSDLQVNKTFRTQSGGEKEIPVWRFAGSRFMPFPKASATRDEFVANLAKWMDDLVAFDQADTFTLPNGRNGKKSYKVLVDSKGNTITPEQYVYELLHDAHTLSSQKVMQTKLRDTATRALRDELGISEPDKKVRTAKVQDGLVDEGELTSEL